MEIPLHDLAGQHRRLAGELLADLGEALRRAAFVGGEAVERFEAEFAGFCQAPHAVAVASGTDALRLALLAAGVGPGDEVVTVAHTFAATAEAVVQAGARVRFVDVEATGGTMDPAALAAAMTPATRAVVPVHLYGRPADMAPILAVAHDHGAAVVEDACQAHGARYRGRPAGTLGDAGCFSFYPTKNLGAIGDGGAVVTGSAGLAERVRLLRDHGQVGRYRHAVSGWNSRLDAIQAAVLRRKLPLLPGWNAARRRHAAAYRELLAGLPLELPSEPVGSSSAWHLFVVRSRRRERLRAGLRAAGVGSGVHYPVPLHRQAAFAGAAGGPLPETDRWAAECLSLPLYPELRDAQLERVAAAAAAALGAPLSLRT